MVKWLGERRRWVGWELDVGDDGRWEVGDGGLGGGEWGNEGVG